MAAQTKIVRIDRPGIGGLKDDPRGPRDALELVDGIYPLGVLTERGGWGAYGASSPLSGEYPTAVLEEIVTASNRTESDIYVATASLLGLATSSLRKGIIPTTFAIPGFAQPGIHFMRGLFNGEVLALPQDGESPIFCSAGATADGDQALATPSIDITDSYKGRSASGSSDFSSGDVGKYVFLDGAHGCRRIVSYVSAGKVVVDVAWDASWTSGGGSESGRVSAVGVLGLHTEVTRVGTVSHTSGNATITGTGTKWNTAALAGQGRPLYFGGYPAGAGTDVIAPLGVDYGTAVKIESIASDTSITTSAICPAFHATDNVDYVIGRPLVGKVACVHEGRLYTAGVRWAPRRLQISPPLWDGRTSQNGEFSYQVDIGKAMMTAYEEVPSPSAAGAITGLMSLPSGNLAVLCDTEVYIGWGQYPAVSFRKQADYGCFEGRSCLAVDEGAWAAGREGVFEFNGNAPRMISGDIDRTWQKLVNEGGSAGPIECTLGMVQDHLFVALQTALSQTWFVWDRRSRTWCGTWSLPFNANYLYPSRVPGARDRLLMAHPDVENEGVSDLCTTITDHLTDVETTENAGSLRMVTAVDIAGDLSQEREVKYAKVTYEVTGSGDPVLEVTPGPDEATPPADGILPATTAGELGEHTLYPVSTVGDTGTTLGERVRRFDLTIEHTGDAADNVALHELELAVKEYRLRDD